MIAIDTSSMVAYLAGETGRDVAFVDLALVERRAVLPAIVVTELLSTARLKPSAAALFLAMPRLEPSTGKLAHCAHPAWSSVAVKDNLSA